MREVNERLLLRPVVRAEITELAPVIEGLGTAERAIDLVDTLRNSEPGALFFFRKDSGDSIFIAVGRATFLNVPEDYSGVQHQAAMITYAALNKAEPGQIYWLYRTKTEQIVMTIARCSEIG